MHRRIARHPVHTTLAVALAAGLSLVLAACGGSAGERLGVTVLFVTHDIDEAVYLRQRVLALSNRPTVVLEDVPIDLPDRRDQLQTRSLPQFAELRGHVYELIQKAKHGHRPPDATES